MLSDFSEKIQSLFKKFRGYGKLTEKEINEICRDIRLLFLESDIALSATKKIVEEIKNRLSTLEFTTETSPGTLVSNIVREELINLLGKPGGIDFSEKPTLVMMVGIQGSGKTTTSAKIANYFATKENKKPLLVGADVRRPAAQLQLEKLSQQIKVPFFTDKDPFLACEGALNLARSKGYDLIIVDTAGRTHVDEELLDELKALNERFHPKNNILVIDSMMGQEATKVAKAFFETIPLTGAILTKFDGDARGGAAFSLREVTGVPLIFLGVGEKIQNLEKFDPVRVVNRIVGMGDIEGLIEKVSDIKIDTSKKPPEEIEKWNFDTFLESMRQIRKMGPLEELLSMIPGFSSIKQMKDMIPDEKQMKRIEAVMLSMTPKERKKPEIIDASRKRRIAKGSGTSIQEVNQLLKQYEMFKKMFKSKNLKKGIKLPNFPIGRI
ncbi:signal recognition particle subunit FFH/SRP54 (srp54) [Thermodesulfobium acidiphilum]|uniref:Signal recognition particle protein n=1 Tax=Thermodesulfobium acidiphilum TaxID=1794699 RepID=A0A2R4W095_THEAF|nr:signal recognition particle protein [Thermodesulfobium acidiphilum]AWB10223.1 signal recognition particle subunit FFH/SRP54 (srp54) [Thermodesulfobium acidiphilum]